MKKLLVAASAVAMAAGAFAAPQVYEYKAALKNMYLKEVKVTTGTGQSRATYKVYMKVQKSNNLKGWLIMDTDGVTSPRIMQAKYGFVADDTQPEGSSGTVGKGGWNSLSTGFDYGRNRGFLVVINPSAYKAVRHPKILPAVLDAKWIDTAFAKLGKAQSGLAEGNLYVGGDAVKPVRVQLDYLTSDTEAFIPGVYERGQIPYVPYSEAETNYTGMVAVADYVWTSIYLFAGSTEKDAFYNGPNWFEDTFSKFEWAWDKNLPELLQTGWATNKNGVVTRSPKKNYFHDTWMNGTGVGKWSRGKIIEELCCGADESVGDNDVVLESLSGNLKGGLFICTENGIVAQASAKGYVWFDPEGTGVEWEDQFNTARITPADMFAPDGWQNDLWQDGFFEIETTDVIYGTWSIKFANSKFFANDTKKRIAKDLTTEEVATLKKYTSKYPASYKVVEEVEEEVEDPTSEDPKIVTYIYSTEYTGGVWGYNALLWSAINGAAKNLLAKANVFDGKEIYKQTVSTHHTEGELPMVTPQFALFYRLVYASNYTGTQTKTEKQ